MCPSKFIGIFNSACHLERSPPEIPLTRLRYATVRFRFAPLRMTRAGAVETRRANGLPFGSRGKCQNPLKHKDFSHFCKTYFCCEYVIVTEQKARTTYDNILRLSDDPDVNDVIKFLRAREIVHYQRFADAIRIAQDNLDSKNFYACNPSFDKNCSNKNCR